MRRQRGLPMLMPESSVQTTPGSEPCACDDEAVVIARRREIYGGHHFSASKIVDDGMSPAETISRLKS